MWNFTVLNPNFLQLTYHGLQRSQSRTIKSNSNCPKIEVCHFIAKRENKVTKLRIFHVLTNRFFWNNAQFTSGRMYFISCSPSLWIGFLGHTTIFTINHGLSSWWEEQMYHERCSPVWGGVLVTSTRHSYIYLDKS